jgi:N-acetyl-gamma-glutamyl-phosphate reductase
MKVGVAGASGYAGAELLRLLSGHPSFEVVVATGQRNEGAALAAHTPSLGPAYQEMSYAPTTAASLVGLDLVFLALPHGASQQIVPKLIGSVGHVVDLGADFRLSPETYEHWYGEAHVAPELCDLAAYGLVERNRTELADAVLVAVPGCYPTATTLALAPFTDASAIEPTGLVIDATSGVSGAGRGVSERLQFSEVDESFSAYGLLTHRHTAEIEANLGVQALFTPHLAPMVRGMLVTAYARPAMALTTASALDLLGAAYDDEPFVHVVAEPPTTKMAMGSNACFVTARVDERTGWLLVLSAIDNLGKGAAGQALQCANLVTGLAEATGLSSVGVYP